MTKQGKIDFLRVRQFYLLTMSFFLYENDAMIVRLGNIQIQQHQQQRKRIHDSSAIGYF